MRKGKGGIKFRLQPALPMAKYSDPELGDGTPNILQADDPVRGLLG
jgi:hypothetical protein